MKLHLKIERRLEAVIALCLLCAFNSQFAAAQTQFSPKVLLQQAKEQAALSQYDKQLSVKNAPPASTTLSVTSKNFNIQEYTAPAHSPYSAKMKIFICLDALLLFILVRLYERRQEHGSSS